jgi:hypothetical protein
MDDDELGTVQGVEPSGESTPGHNPAWDDVLGVLPDEFHPVVTKHFADWDRSAQTRIEQANQTAKQYEAYKDFVDNGIGAEELGQGLQLMYQINNNPGDVVKALQEAYGLTEAQAEQLVDEEGDEDETPDPYGPRLDQLQQGFDLVAQTILSQHQEKVNAEAEQQLEHEITAATEKHGPFDVNYVLSLMAVDPENVTMDKAIGAYQQLTQNILQQNPRPFAPQVMGNSAGGAGLPSQAIDPTKLDDKGRRGLVAQMLAAEFGPQR